MFKVLLFFLFALFAPLCGNLFAVPQLPWTVTVEQPQPQDIILRRGETIDLKTTWRNNSAALDLSGYTNVYLYYRGYGQTTGSAYCVTGSVTSATGGITTVRWTPSCEPTNTRCVYDLAVLGTNTVIVRSYGLIRLDSTLVGGTPALVTNSIVDWSTLTHLNLSSGPFVIWGSSTDTYARAQAAIAQTNYVGALNSASGTLAAATAIAATNLQGNLNSASQALASATAIAATNFQGNLNSASQALASATAIAATNLQGNLNSASQALASATAIAATNLQGNLNSASQALASATAIAATNFQGSLNSASQALNSADSIILSVANAASNAAVVAATNLQGNLTSGLLATTNYVNGVSNNAIAAAAIAATNLQGNITSGLLATTNYVNGVSNNAIAAAAVAATNAHNLYLPLAGGIMSGQIDFGGLLATNLAGIEDANQHRISYFGDGVWRIFGYGQAAGATPTPANLSIWTDWTGIYFNSNITMYGAHTIDLNGGAISNGNIYGNGVGVTNLPGLKVDDGYIWITSSANKATSIWYHVTSLPATNKIGEFWTSP